MYFPFLRGKQFELIALREISDVMAGKREKVSPIIEPVKNSSTFKTTLKTLALNNVNFNIIVNPTVGDLQDETIKIIEILKGELPEYANYQVAIVIKEKTKPSEIIALLKETELSFKGITFIHYSVREGVADFIAKVQDFPVIYNVIHFGCTNKRYYREFDADTRVSLDDFFKVQTRNADYLSVSDSSFSEEHLYFSEDGFKGFSDFLTVGEDYSEAGFLPRAVAIHLSYLDDKNKIRIKHFVSDSNEDTADIAGKFGQALEKLIEWNDQHGKMNTVAVKKFKELHSSGHFPGLGTLKKLSVMHHIELLLNLL